MFSNNLLDNISDMVVTAERKGNTFVVTDVLKGENEKECESSTELLKKNSRTAEMIVVSDRNGNTIVVKDNVVPSTNNENEGRRCNNNKNNNEEDNIDDDGSNSTATTLSTIISAVKSLSLSTSSSSNSTSQTLQSEHSPKQSPKQRRRNRITIATLMTGRRGRKLLYLFKIKSNSDRSLSNEEKNVSTDDLDRLLHSSLSTTSSFDSYKC